MEVPDNQPRKIPPDRQFLDDVTRLLRNFDEKFGPSEDLDIDLFESDLDYSLGILPDHEYLYAVKRHRELLKILPNLTPPQSKRRSIEEQLEGIDLPEVPARKVPRSATRVTGTMNNSKGPYAAHWESQIERDYFYLLEFDPEVRHYRTQPLKIPFTDAGGNECTYTPDVLVVYQPDANGNPIRPTKLVDLKEAPELIHNYAKHAEKFKAAATFAAERGWVFEPVTDIQIRRPYLLENVKMLQRPRHAMPTTANYETASQIIRRLFERNKATAAALLRTFKKSAQDSALFVIFMLIARGEIECDLSRQPLDEKTTILTLPSKYTEEHLMSQVTIRPKKSKQARRVSAPKVVPSDRKGDNGNSRR